MYAQMLSYSNRKYHWYGDGDADWLDTPEGSDRVWTFVASVQRRFHSEHLLPHLWFTSVHPGISPNLTFAGRLDRLSEDCAAMTAVLDVPQDVSRDFQAFIDTSPSSNKADMKRARNKNKSSGTELSPQLTLYDEPGANAAMLDVCNMERADFACFSAWLTVTDVCVESWGTDME
jgi:hypothetical protein